MGLLAKNPTATRQAAAQPHVPAATREGARRPVTKQPLAGTPWEQQARSRWSASAMVTMVGLLAWQGAWDCMTMESTGIV